LNGITSLPIYVKIYQSVQKLLAGGARTHTHKDRHTGDFISLLAFFGKYAKKEHLSLAFLNRDSAGSEATGYSLKYRVLIPGWVMDLSLRHHESFGATLPPVWERPPTPQ
jgi:hypothetical protein